MDELTTAISRATTALMQRRHPNDYWEGRLASSPLATAVCFAALVDENDAKINRTASFEYLRRTQNADGGWGDTEISKSNLAATLLVLCADAVQSKVENRKSKMLSDAARQKAESYVAKLGGLRDGLRRVYGKDLTFQVPIRMTAAHAGLSTQDAGVLSWRDVDALPFELALAPRGLMGALGLPVVSYALPALVCVGLSRHAQAPSWFLPARWLRSLCANRALDLTLAMQPKSGGFLEATPITAFCLIGLKAAGRGDHAVARNARRFLEATQREDGSWPVEVNLSIWNTTRAVDALTWHGQPLPLAARADAKNGLAGTDAGGPAGLEAGAPNSRTKEWLLAQQSQSGHVYTGTQPGGWGWNELDGSVPDADDTSGAILAMRRLGIAADHPALQEAARWLLSLQNRDGGWPTFCRGWQKLPFDQSAPDLTAHALRAMQALGMTAHPAYAAGWSYLQKVQRADGSFAPLWFGCEQAADELNATYGTAHVLFACEQGGPYAVGIRDRALAWLRSIQNLDGGFGGCKDARSTAEETGLALRALATLGGREDFDRCERAAQWLIENQREDGSWDPAPIGFYFAVLWYYEELYPLCYALGGLNAWAKALSATPSGSKAEVARV